jgi:hypothetical protein
MFLHDGWDHILGNMLFLAIGGFTFGLLVTRVLARAGQVAPGAIRLHCLGRCASTSYQGRIRFVINYQH